MTGLGSDNKKTCFQKQKYSPKVAPACLELMKNNEGQFILVAIVCHADLDKVELDKEELDKENDLPVVKKCCPHGHQLTEDHRSCSAVRNGKANLPPRYGSPTFAQLRYTITLDEEKNHLLSPCQFLFVGDTLNFKIKMQCI